MAVKRARNPSLGALFLVLGIGLIGVAAEAVVAASKDHDHGLYVVTAAAGAIALWLLGLAVRLLRPR